MPVEPPVVSPRTLAEAYAILAGAPHRPVAGGTDLLVQLTGEIGPAPERVIDLWRVEELRGIRVRDGALELGALTTYTQIRGSDACSTHAPALVAAAATIGAAQIQNRGTIGGNVMNASPAGDTLPVLLALDASLVVGGPAGERSIPAAEFWPAYRKTALKDGELLLRVRIPIVEGRFQAFRKVGTRRAQAISKVVAGGRVAARPGLARRPHRLRVRRRDADPGPGRRGGARRRAGDARDHRRRRRGASRRAPSHRRRTLDRRVSPRGLGPDPAAHPGGRGLSEMGANQYGKSSIRLVKVDKRTDRHELRDLTVDIALAGDFAASYTDGDNSLVIATDTMKNTVYAFAPEHLTGAIEAFALVLARHFLDSPQVASASDPHRRARMGAARGRRRAGARRVPAHRRRDAHGLGGRRPRRASSSTPASPTSSS